MPPKRPAAAKKKKGNSKPSSKPSSKQSQSPKPDKEPTPPANQATVMTGTDKNLEAGGGSPPELSAAVADLECLKATHNDWGARCNRWDTKTIGDLEEIFLHLFINVGNWAYRNIDAPALDSLSASTKQDLLRRLEGYCLQADLNETMSRLCPLVRNAFADKLVTMLLIKDCITRFFINPFWYIAPDPNPAPDTDEGIQARPTEFGKQLYTFFEISFQPGTDSSPRGVYGQSASPTHRIPFFDPHRTISSDFSTQMHERRESMVDVMVQQVLTDPLLQTLLTTPENKDDATSRDRELKEIYQEAARLAVDISTHTIYLEFRTLDNIEPRFQRPSTDLEPSARCGLQEIDNRPDGHRILAMSYPAIYVHDDMTQPPLRSCLVKGCVLLENDQD
ncbi:uncharacterized protein BO80DRAFT_445833 [Aspergillus ibericus CBS 121593]|uniref:Uncharacterized protein n=1 Tax=Aspergillus ibericus CBS 121593 TaxID=1448316 RepID=A0A395GX33_9EURO|nr:hypothetical protein BO80DRAFT_445833 [Aspergillus ibericus CBS 121593]RAL00131.1 hypothetical protein BO80DRAFT_445833 [Aspergillus ibericus CBS 121593]